ncbi:MAG: hypothetical protein ACI9QN_000845, partial [Arcticibacterium sp.]
VPFWPVWPVGPAGPILPGSPLSPLHDTKATVEAKANVLNSLTILFIILRFKFYLSSSFLSNITRI